MGMLNDALADYYCIKIRRYGALGIEEEAGQLHLHAVSEDEVDKWLDVTVATLGPGDRAVITLTRGLQSEQAARAAQEDPVPTSYGDGEKPGHPRMT